MKFCDKLSKLRKNNNLSQEQLADRLGVSRQAVSKWESGISHPDMEKIIEICKILDCTLDELMDDNIVGEKYKNITNDDKKNYFKDFLNFITKTYNMFCTMKFKDILKCVVELLVIILLLTAAGSIIFYILDSMTFGFLAIAPYEIQYSISTFIGQFYKIALIVIGTIITIHLFKIRYLDYYITIEDNLAKERSIEKPIVDEEDSSLNKENVPTEKIEKEKIIIRDPKHSSYSFFDVFAKIISFIARIFASLILFVLFIFFLFLITVSIVIFYHVIYGEIFVALSIISIGLLIILFCAIKVVYNFIFKVKTKHKVIFSIFIISIVMLGAGMGFTLISLTNYKKVSNFDDIEKEEHTEYVEIKENFNIYSYNNTEYRIDNSLDNRAKIVISAIKGTEYDIYSGIYPDSSYITIYLKNVDYGKIYDIIMNDLKNKQYRDYHERDFMNVIIYLNEENYYKLYNRYY